jgi:hypothetical protein
MSVSRRALLISGTVVALPHAQVHAQPGKMQSWPLGTARRTGIHDVPPGLVRPQGRPY